MAIYKYNLVFFFQAEDGIRDKLVTGVQTCALPIFRHHVARLFRTASSRATWCRTDTGDCPRGRRSRNWPRVRAMAEIGRASCRKSVDLGGRRIVKKEN